MIDVTLIYNKSNPFGISKDVEGIRKALGGEGYSFRESDPLEPPVTTDIAIHLEVPMYSWMPWAAANVLVVNPEWFEEAAWRPYMPRFDMVLYKDSVARAAAIAAGLVTEAQARIVPWGAQQPEAPPKGKKVPTGDVNTGFVWFLGASKNKRAAVAPLLTAWKEEYPPLRIYTTEPMPDLSGGAEAVATPANVRIEVRDLDAPTRLALGRFFRGHVACSRAEGFGYTAAEAEWLGAFTILSDLPVYQECYAGEPGVGFLPHPSSGSAYEEAVARAVSAFEAANFATLAKERQMRAAERWDAFCANFLAAIRSLGAPKKAKHLPPIVAPADCPPISVVTLLYNRRKFFDLACHSLMIQDYPKDKIQWIIVEDSDDPAEDASDRVMAVAAQAAPVDVVYIPLKKKRTVGAKRNLGVQKATADIVLMMDDDDHYPETSFRRRVAWLTAHPWQPQAVAATTIACYDLVHGVSAVNSPPFTLPLSQRISEATLTFRKSWWEARGFPADVQVGEGESFTAGREADVLEIPPQQAIVAFSHGKNASSRRLPSGEGLKPGCFWGFPAPFLKFIHELAGVKVVDEDGAAAGSTTTKRRSH
jgi:hypothetical protein